MRRLIPKQDTERYRVLEPGRIAIHYGAPRETLVTWDGRSAPLKLGDLLRLTRSFVHGSEPLHAVVDDLCGTAP